MRALLLLLISGGVCFGQLQGIIDIHTHGDPDSAARKIDVLELAKIAKAAGMRGIVLKNHYAPTVQAAYLVSEVVPGIEVFGAIALDRAVGGVNPEAVRQAAAFKGKKLRIVWMPTFGSRRSHATGNCCRRLLKCSRSSPRRTSFWRPDIRHPRRIFC